MSTSRNPIYDAHLATQLARVRESLDGMRLIAQLHPSTAAIRSLERREVELCKLLDIPVPVPATSST